jgi:hypothetical protein
MRLPFTVDEFLGVFASYNETVWPAQVLLTAMAVVAVGLAVRRQAFSHRVIAGILAALWLWTGVVYHLAFFTAINGAAYVFGALCVLQAAAFVAFGVVRPALRFEVRPTIGGAAGALLVTYAFVGYPLVGAAVGHAYPRLPTFGVPCPTTIFTLGMLLWSRRPLAPALALWPLLWAGIGTAAAVSLGMTEDLGLTAAGVVAALLIFGGALRPITEGR